MKSLATLRTGMAHLDSAAKFQLYELDERDESVEQIDHSDHGNIQTRLVRCPDAAQVRSRFAATVGKVLSLAPQAEVTVISPTELSFRLHGLEFARARLANAPGSFQVEEEVIFGPLDMQRVSARRLRRHSQNSSRPLLRRAAFRATAATRSGACIRSAGWNRWCLRTLPPLIPGCMPAMSILRCRRFPLPIAR